MSGKSVLFNFSKPKDKAEKSGEKEERRDGGRSSKFSIAGSSEAPLLVNETDQKLILRDKIGAAYGEIRYKIPGRSKIKVTNLPHSRFKMIAYAIEEEKEVGEHSSNEAHQGNHKKTKKSIDTKLSIHSDRLATCERIVISFDGSEYKVHFVPR